FTVKRMLNEFESKHPGTRYSLMRGYERVSEFLPARLPGRKLLQCERCGEASASRICKACEMIERMKYEKTENKLGTQINADDKNQHG
ncbi:MAG: hypothetical protein H0M93_05110, partial [Methanophagales archaeon]|nr:hypothetical protein [Methanophagales archaeon]